MCRLFRKDWVVIEPNITDKDVLIMNTNPIRITKSIIVSVPEHCQAVGYVDQIPVAFQSCTKEKLKDIFKKKLNLNINSYMDKNIMIAYIVSHDAGQVKWGLNKPTHIYNKELGQAFSLNAYGEIHIRVSKDPDSYHKLIDHFPDRNIIYTHNVREYALPQIKDFIQEVINKYLNDNPISVFELDRNKQEIKDRIMPVLNEYMINEFGLEVFNMSMQFHIDPDDLLNIKKGINKRGI